MQVISMLLQDSQTGHIYDVSDLVSDILWETQISGQPGKLTFNIEDDDEINFKRGSTITYKVTKDGVETGCFFGYVFTSEMSDDSQIQVTCYDQLRYLQNKDFYVVENKTASQVFEMVCLNNQLKNYKVIDAATSVIPPRIHDGVSMFDIIDWGIGHELRTSKKWFMIRDNFGTLEFIDIANLYIPPKELSLTDKSNIYGFKYSASIDSDTYNQVKIMQENRENKKGKVVKSGGKVVSRDFGFSKSDVSINQWGLLQYFEKSDKHLNPAQLQMYADSILSQKNREKTTFSVVCEGDLRVNSGSQVFIFVDKVKNELPDYYKFLVTACAHRFSNQEHTMELQVYMPQYGVEGV